MNVILEKRNNTSPDAEKAMKIAGDIDIYTNHNVIIESITNE